MSPKVRMRHRMSVILHMVIAFVTVLLMAQLWLFTVTLDTMENKDISIGVALAALTISLLSCGAVWALIRFFLRTEEQQ